MTTGLKFNENQLRLALYDVQDILERALVPFILLNETAASIRKNMVLTGDKISIGVESKYLTKTARNTIEFYLRKSKNVIMTDKGFTYNFNNVPIEVAYIAREYPFFKNLDFRFYMANEYKVPNPWLEYWNERDKVL